MWFNQSLISRFEIFITKFAKTEKSSIRSWKSENLETQPSLGVYCKNLVKAPVIVDLKVIHVNNYSDINDINFLEHLISLFYV